MGTLGECEKEAAVKYIKQFFIILSVSFAGEALRAFLPLPVPASVYGLILMLGLLKSRILKVSQVKETSALLIEIMPVMFIPAAVGLLTAWEDLRPVFVPVMITTGATTVIVMAVTAMVTQKVIGMEGKRK